MTPRAGSVALLGALALFPAPSRAADDDPLLARVNGHEIRLSHVYRQVEALPLGDQVAIRARIDRFAESLVHEEILFQSVLAAGLDSDPELRTAVKTVVVEILIRRQVTERIRVTDEDVATYYRENTSGIRGESVRAAQIVLAARKQCEALMVDITSEAAFRDAAAQHSLDSESAARGGDMGPFMNHRGSLGFETQLFAMRPGQMRVFDAPGGCHLVRVIERITPPLPPLADVEARIRALLETREERALLRALLEAAERTVTVERPAAN